jgi:hypothetical protein
LSAIGAYSDGTHATLSSQVTWNASDASLVTVDPNGLVTAVKAGAVTITATMKRHLGNHGGHGRFSDTDIHRGDRPFDNAGRGDDRAVDRRRYLL